VLQRSDYLVIALPVTPETRGLIEERQLRAMKPSAVLVNVSRADIVEEDSLYRALAERTIAAAALDVWYRYPTQAGPTRPSRQPFHELPNVLMTPQCRAGPTGCSGRAWSSSRRTSAAPRVGSPR
jgi:phosphoglycerate dehydrogenase-like enzyme